MSTKEHIRDNSDITDPERDLERMQPEETTIDMPDAEEIPGQENIRVPQMKQFHDTTISSADEEGEGLFDDDTLDPDTDVTDEERELLRSTENSMAGIDDEERRRSMLDQTDLDGTRLNEKVNVSGDDLDVPGSEEDDGDEEIGEEDEENNSYSLGGDRKD